MKDSITKALLIYYNFPPYASGGSFRPAKMAKYLPSLYISPKIICADNIPRRPTDSDLMKDIPRHLEIRRVPVRFENSIYYRVMYKLGRVPWLNARYKPETTIKWANDVLPVARGILEENGIDRFLVSAPPWSMVVLGLKLKKATGAKFILEYRDPWTQGPFYKPPREELRKEFEEMEDDALRAADAVVMVTETFAKLMVKRRPFLIDKIHVVPNGYDPDDFPMEYGKPDPWKNRLAIVYAGSIYTDYHTDVFIDALKLLVEKKPELKDEMVLSYMGFMDRRQKRYIENSGVGDMVEYNDYVPHRSTLSMLSAADLAILSLPGIPNAGGHISAKIYEYMASGTPVLASIPQGEMSALIEGAQCGWVVPPDDPKAVADRLDYLHRLWKDDKLSVEPNAEYVARFTRKEAASKLAEIIKAV